MSVTDWRIGEHYGIHVYDGDRPVATFHDEADARTAVACVKRVNGGPRTQEPAVAGTRRPKPDLADWPLIVREVIEQGHPYYGTDVDEVLRDYALAVMNAVNTEKARADMAERKAQGVADDSKRVQAVYIVLRNAGNRKNVERHAVQAALTSPDWRIANPDA